MILLICFFAYLLLLWLEIMQKFVCDGNFRGNILVVGRTDCGKTTFVQRLAVNNIFGKLGKAGLVLEIRLSKQCEA